MMLSNFIHVSGESDEKQNVAKYEDAFTALHPPHVIFVEMIVISLKKNLYKCFFNRIEIFYLEDITDEKWEIYTVPWSLLKVKNKKKHSLENYLEKSYLSPNN